MVRCSSHSLCILSALRKGWGDDLCLGLSRLVMAGVMKNKLLGKRWGVVCGVCVGGGGRMIGVAVVMEGDGEWLQNSI